MELSTLNISENCSVLYNVVITDNAAKQIILLSNRDFNIKGIRLKVSHSGCAGLIYKMDVVKVLIESDLSFCHMGATLYVSLSDIEFINGIKVDYVINEFSSMFTFNNPKASRFCGCGKSFNI
ncbi:iron-sulfur cluster assembly accessory protein [Candidatus Purcelliella pentastirinorum]|uniref:Iron-sulfur cluster assembly accessory protein n=1 Tax=Candidatus Purcelliella pentastirinorum TaxID=472834 RepID=A0AAX3N832_9ENTR|nr:iron-sulfur cluster assembly accessory protein [Candidatus Purcelliella pentastirinorum]WDI78611.1 iron-sulfur cluster assembly accessory protein [Candidatus Purcelliella pentastirinorum]WDR80361.1 iron-sulfur cluster assembly accessory protein [Candidatus Purcelliella pentastirinorum]